MKALGMRIPEKKRLSITRQHLASTETKNNCKEIIKTHKNFFFRNQVIWGNQVTLGLFLQCRDTVFKRRNFFSDADRILIKVFLTSQRP